MYYFNTYAKLKYKELIIKIKIINKVISNNNNKIIRSSNIFGKWKSGLSKNYFNYI